MIKTVSLLFMAATLSGCASLSYPLPKCDGYTRRPLNRAMWQREENKNLSQKHADIRPATSSSVAAAYTEEEKKPPAFAHLDIDSFYRRCEG